MNSEGAHSQRANPQRPPPPPPPDWHAQDVMRSSRQAARRPQRAAVILKHSFLPTSTLRCLQWLWDTAGERGRVALPWIFRYESSFRDKEWHCVLCRA
jgi:hypothetical protein